MQAQNLCLNWNSQDCQTYCLKLIEIHFQFFRLGLISFRLHYSCLQDCQPDSFFLSNFKFHLLFYHQFQILQSRYQDHTTNYIVVTHFVYQLNHYFCPEMKNHQDLLLHYHRFHSIFSMQNFLPILFTSIMLLIQLSIQIL